ncbi:MAG: hypothetical protein M1819_004317 [Sarea resinae]|nr:MAG: hypothetical protein M1819_004317 [Sarea resinae]
MADQPEKKNIVVIGGGIIGCSTAYFLTRHPSYNPATHTITLLEASKIAGGASGKAGGLLALWAYPSNIVPLSYRLHAELAKEHNGEERWGYRRIHCGQLSAKGRPNSGSTIGSDSKKNGGSTDSVSLQKRTKEAVGLLRAAGVPTDLDWFAPECIKSYDEMGDPDTTAQVHPYQFTTSMAALAAEKGAKILEHSPVQSINYNADKSAIESITYVPNGEDSQTPTTLPATTIILAAGPWTSTLLPQAPISALRAHSIVIRPSRPVSAYALFTDIRAPSTASKRSTTQILTPEIYARPNNEVYACGEGDVSIPLPRTSDLVAVDPARCDEIRAAVGAISDELRDGDVTARQACYLPNVRPGAGSSGPLVGWTGIEGLVLAAGHTCWGIQNAPGTGKCVSEFVFDGRATSAKIAGLDPRKAL